MSKAGMVQLKFAHVNLSSASNSTAWRIDFIADQVGGLVTVTSGMQDTQNQTAKIGLDAGGRLLGHQVLSGIKGIDSFGPYPEIRKIKEAGQRQGGNQGNEHMLVAERVFHDELGQKKTTLDPFMFSV